MALAAALVSAHCSLCSLDGADDRSAAGAALELSFGVGLASCSLCPLRGGSRNPTQWWVAPRRLDRHGGWPRGACGTEAGGYGRQPGGCQWRAGSRDGAAAASRGADPTWGPRSQSVLCLAAFWARVSPLWAMVRFDYLRVDGTAAFHRDNARPLWDALPTLLAVALLAALVAPLPLLFGGVGGDPCCPGLSGDVWGDIPATAMERFSF